MSSHLPAAEENCLNLLLFSVAGVSFAVDLEQIDGMAEHAGELPDDLHWFHDELGFACQAMTYRLPTVLSIKTGSGTPYRVIIDNMEEIAEFSFSSITPFPDLLESHLLSRGLWGVLLRAGKMVLLVDFQRIASNSRMHTYEP